MVKPVARKQNELYKPVVEKKQQQSHWRGRKISMPSAHDTPNLCKACIITTLGCICIASLITSCYFLTGCTRYDPSEVCQSKAIASLALSAIGLVSGCCLVSIANRNSHD